MRRSVRAPFAQMQAQEKLLRKQLFLAIIFLFAIVGICCLNFKTYDPVQKIANEEVKDVSAAQMENLKAENVEMQKAIKDLKRELASQKKKSAKAKEEKKDDEKKPEPQVASETAEVSTAYK